MKKFSLIIAIVLATFSLQGQSGIDALRYSQNNGFGTARATALGGSIVSIGGDSYTVSHNPAGLGLFRKSKFTISPGMSFANTSAVYLGNTAENNNTKVHINNVGFVFQDDFRPSKQEKGWQSAAFSITMNRTANFNQRESFSGVRSNHSLMDHFAELGQGLSIEALESDNPIVNGFDTRLGYYGYLIDPDPENVNSFVSIIDDKVSQEQVWEEKGGIHEIALGYGANYKNKFYVGGSLGIPIVNYNSTTYYTEEDIDNTNELWNYFNITDQIEASGAGVNFKLGMIYRITNALRAGFTFHTPTFYTISEDYNTVLEAQSVTSVGMERTVQESPFGFYEYNLQTPLKVAAGLSYFFDQNGFVSVDYEMMDYGTMKFDFSETEFIGDQQNRNNEIANAYDAQHVVKVGAEYVLDQQIYLRGGYQFGSDFIAANDEDGSFNNFSGGIGFQADNVQFDLGFINRSHTLKYQPYTLENETVEQVTSDRTLNDVVLTVGFRF